MYNKYPLFIDFVLLCKTIYSVVEYCHHQLITDLSYIPHLTIVLYMDAALLLRHYLLIYLP